MNPDSRTILIVDDDEINLDILEANLDSQGYRVLRACDGVEALALARDRSPDMVITDILMPVMDGYKLCRSIRSDTDLSSTPVIFYSATYTDPEDQRFALSLGAARFVIKPEDPDEFQQVVSGVFREVSGAEAPEAPAPELDDQGYLMQYNRRLVAKLEDKLEELTATNRRLAEEIALKEEAESRVRHLAYHDPLTGLGNRTKFVEDLDLRFRETDDERALLVLDVDQFREVTHTLGHQNGNRLLREISRRLGDLPICSRSVASRLGGNRFAFLLPDVVDRSRAEQAARDLMNCIEEPFDLDGIPIRVTASVGVSFYPEHAQDAALLIRHAAVALQRRRGGRRMVLFYEPDSDPYQPKRLALIGSLRDAIANDQLTLFFQPKIDLDARRTIAAEALVRWTHPEYGFLAPDTFVRLAEQTGQIQDLTRWVTRTALSQLASWHREKIDLGLSVNLSARDLLDDDLPDHLGSVLEEHRLETRALTVEVTESAILQDPDRARTNLETLTEMGVRVAIDDFGTGYSSLSHLKLLPVHELKIDKSFVFNMAEQESDAVIVHSTIGLAHNLGLEVTAEGVETEEVRDRLTDLRCDMAQGYLMSPPLPKDDFVDWLRTSDWGRPD